MWSMVDRKYGREWAAVSDYNHKDALVDGSFMGKVLITTLCSDTICFANKHCGGCQRGNGIAFKVANIEQRGERCCWVSTCIPKVCPIIYSQYNVSSPTFSPDLTHAWRRGWGGLHQAGCCQQPTATALSAIPLIITQRSPCVEPNCEVLGVNGAKTSEESPLKDNKKTADWLQTTQRGIRAFHMNINVILTGNLPQERGRKRQQKRRSKWKGVKINERGGVQEDRTLRFVSHR